MSRKDYEAIAAAIKRETEVPGIEGEWAREVVRLAQLNVAKAIALALQADNPRFDRARFLRACGLE